MQFRDEMTATGVAMETTERVGRRTVSRVDDRIPMGGDSQVDNRNVLIAPMNPVITDPFLLLSEDWFSTTGFEWHPHRGIETVTLVLDGVLEHGDNLGNVGALVSGDVQWMTAGRGIIHRELAFRNEHAHTLQLWVNLPNELKLIDTGYQDLPAAIRPVVERDGLRIDPISGAFGDAVGPARNNWPISGALITLEPDRKGDLLLPGHDRAFFYAISGEVGVADRTLRSGQIAWSDPLPHVTASVITLANATGDLPSVVMVYSGQPIGQPVVMGGPFVMSTETEIEQAFADFHTGKFGDTPRQLRLETL
jgi:quercetin 2,3-dioxygenase